MGPLQGGRLRSLGALEREGAWPGLHEAPVASSCRGSAAAARCRRSFFGLGFLGLGIAVIGVDR